MICFNQWALAIPVLAGLFGISVTADVSVSGNAVTKTITTGGFAMAEPYGRGGCSPQGPWYSTLYGFTSQSCQASCLADPKCKKAELAGTRCEKSEKIYDNQGASGEDRHCFIKENNGKGLKCTIKSLHRGNSLLSPVTETKGIVEDRNCKWKTGIPKNLADDGYLVYQEVHDSDRARPDKEQLLARYGQAWIDKYKGAYGGGYFEVLEGAVEVYICSSAQVCDHLDRAGGCDGSSKKFTKDDSVGKWRAKDYQCHDNHVFECYSGIVGKGKHALMSKDRGSDGWASATGVFVKCATPVTTTSTLTTTTTMTTTTTITTATSSTTTTTNIVCGSGEYIYSSIWSKQECRTCAYGTFRDEEAHSHMSCVEWSECKDDEHEVEKATSKSDTECDSTTECGDDEYEYRAPRAGRTNRQCKAITQCDDGEYISTPAKYNRNQRCRRCDKSTASYDGGCTSTTRTTSTRTSTTRTFTTRTRSTTTKTTITTSTASTTTTTTTQTLTTTTSTLDKIALDALGKSLLDVIAQEQEQGIDEEDQVSNLLARGYSLYEVMESEAYTFDEIVGAGITRSKAEATQASISSAGKSGTGGGDGSTTTVIAIVVVSIILAIGGAAIYVNKARGEGNAGDNVVSFENPMFGAGSGIDSHSGLNNFMYEDGYMDVNPGNNAGGSQGYMDVSGSAGPEQFGFEDPMASKMAQMEAKMGGFDCGGGGEGSDGEDI